MTEDPNIVEGLKKLRAAFPSRCFVGGSYGRHLVLPEYGYDDIDVFIVGPRQMEPWVMVLMLEQLFDRVDNKIKYDQDHDPDVVKDRETNLYMMEHQHGRIVCHLGCIQFDLIFIDTPIDSIISDQTASSLSCFYHDVTYDTHEMLHLYDHPDTRKAIGDIKVGQTCIIQKGRCTEDHLNKIRRACDNPRLHLRVIPPSNPKNILNLLEK